MSGFDTSTFYSTPRPPSSDEGVQLPEMNPQSQTEAARETKPENPPYTRYADQGGASFAPASETTDPSFQASHELPVAAGPEINWMLLGVLGLAALWWMGRDQGYER